MGYTQHMCFCDTDLIIKCNEWLFKQIHQHGWITRHENQFMLWQKWYFAINTILCSYSICSETGQKFNSDGPEWPEWSLCEAKAHSRYWQCEEENQNNSINIESCLEWNTRLVNAFIHPLSILWCGNRPFCSPTCVQNTCQWHPFGFPIHPIITFKGGCKFSPWNFSHR